uniref:Uncharacterized protein n=1 Tax=Klebsiella pneumoniae TaxID=573 RepID=A0A7S5GG61_KLEPN|nr:hypothetical protein pKpnB199_00061 [Klebsiella pneumoniae]
MKRCHDAWRSCPVSHKKARQRRAKTTHSYYRMIQAVSS